MKEHLTEIGIAITGIATTAVAWYFGGKQRSKVEADDVLMRGADSIVDTTNKLLDRLNTIVEEERTRTNEERQHRETCEASLREHKKLIDDLKKKVSALEKTIR